MFVERNRFKLRDYQDRCVSAALETARSAAQVRTMVNAPTGSGKTYIEVGYVRERTAEGRSCLILTNTQEQLEQTAKALRKAGLAFSVEYGRNTAVDSVDRIILSTVQTMRSRLGSYREDRFDDLVVDECHHSLAPGHRKVFAHFLALAPQSKGANPEKYTHTSIFGVTATPGKTSISQDLIESCFTDGVCADFDTRAAMESGILCPAEGTIKPAGDILDLREIERDADARHLKDYDGTLVGKQLSVIMEILASDIAREGTGRKTIVFAPSVDFARKLAKTMRQQNKGRKSRILEVYGDTPDGLRARTVRSFDRAPADSSTFLINYAVATEGFDSPSVNTIYNLRPTRLPDLLTQMLGRGLRTDPENPGKVCRIISLDWNRAECCQPSIILSSNAILSEEVSREMRSARPGEYVDMLDSVRRKAAEFHAANENTYTVELETALKIANVRERGSQFRKARLQDLEIIRDAGIDVSKTIPYHAAKDLAAEIRKREEKGLATFRQMDCLLNGRGRMYYRDLWEISEAEAEKRIREDGVGPTARASRLLSRFGIQTDSADKAFEMIDAIRLSGFSVPERYRSFVTSEPTEKEKEPERTGTENIVNVTGPARKKVVVIKKSALESSSANRPGDTPSSGHTEKFKYQKVSSLSREPL